MPDSTTSDGALEGLKTCVAADCCHYSNGAAPAGRLGLDGEGELATKTSASVMGEVKSNIFFLIKIKGLSSGMAWHGKARHATWARR